MMKHALIGLLLILLPMAAVADPVEIDGIYYNLIKKAGLAEVAESPQTYTGDIVIPDTVVYNDQAYRVTTIGSMAFAHCRQLKSVKMPNSVTSIDYMAFGECRNIKEIPLPDSLKTIGNMAFYHCAELENVSIPASVEHVGSYVFTDCKSLKAVYIKDLKAWCRLSWTGGNPLEDAHTLYVDGKEVKELVIPEGISAIGKAAFSGCNMTSLSIPGSVTSIEPYAFAQCKELTTVALPTSIDSISSYIFAGCSALESLTIPASVRTIGNYAFSHCGALTEMVIPEGVTKIGLNAFEGCTALASISIPGSVDDIGDGCFYQCTSLQDIPSLGSATKIGNYSFYECTGMKSINIPDNISHIGMSAFVHLNVHSHYSMMDSCAGIEELVDAAIKDKMPGMALTDDVIMSGVMEFFDYVSLINKTRLENKKTPFKPIIGCQLPVYAFAGREEKGRKTKKFHVIALAKNMKGYQNLMKLASIWESGPGSHLVDDKSLKKYREGLIILYGGFGSEAAECVKRGDMKELEQGFKWYKETFGEDFYIEIQRNTSKGVDEQIPMFIEQEKRNAVLAETAKAFGVKIVATNNVRFIKPEDWTANFTQRCEAKGKTRMMMEDGRHFSCQFRNMKRRKEMYDIFADMPEAVENTMEIFDKVEFFDIKKTPVIPSVKIPESFAATETDKETRQQEYLDFLTHGKAKAIYGELLPEEVTDCLHYELDVIAEKKVAAYFLFLEEVVRVAQTELDTWVGPGRSSAPGSLVCYCLGITKIGPLKYGLLFERFINPEKNIYPDIDLDIEAEGKESVLEWLKSKYGEDRCANVICFRSFIPSTALKTAAKVRERLTPETERVIEKLSYENLYPWRSLKDAMMFDEDVKKLVRKSDPEMRAMLNESAVLDNTVNCLGIHACAFVVSDSPIVCNAPVTVAKYKDEDGNIHRMNCVEYESRHIEKSGLVVFDFLSLDALSQIKEMVKMIKEDTGQDIDIEHIPLDDAETIRLFQYGRAERVFQFVGEGMQLNLMEMHPENFEDLAVINSLYRPGTLEVMRKYFERKKGRKPVKFSAPFMENFLGETYGIIVYQEQIMKIAQVIGGFTPGESDKLRKAIFKDDVITLGAMEKKFVKAAQEKGYAKKYIKKAWMEITLNGRGTFNKSHAVCYTWIAYQMGYLKAHYPEVFTKVMDAYGS